MTDTATTYNPTPQPEGVPLVELRDIRVSFGGVHAVGHRQVHHDAGGLLLPVQQQHAPGDIVEGGVLVEPVQPVLDAERVAGDALVLGVDRCAGLRARGEDGVEAHRTPLLPEPSHAPGRVVADRARQRLAVDDAGGVGHRDEHTRRARPPRRR